MAMSYALIHTSAFWLLDFSWLSPMDQRIIHNPLEKNKRNDYQSAMNHLVAALEYAPYNETVSYALAIIYKSTCQYDKAERAIEMSLNAYPDNPAGIQLLEDIKIEKANY